MTSESPASQRASDRDAWTQAAWTQERADFAAAHGVDLSAASVAPLLTLLREDFAAHYHSVVHPGWHALCVYRLGHWGRFRTGPTRRLVKVVHRLLNRLVVQNVYGAEIADEAFIGRHVVIAHQQGVQIPPYSVVGDDSIIRHNVTLGMVGTEGMERVPSVGRGVEIGTGASLLGRIRVGDHAKIGPHALVLVNVPAGATAFSQPARIFTSEQAAPQ